MNIECEQFIYGKLSNIERGRYGVIARSPNLSTDVDEVRRLFNGCRPTKIASFNRAYAVASLSSEKVILLRIDRSTEKEIGRNYLLQEHYVILRKKTVEEKGMKTWLWLIGLPGPESFMEFTELSEQISINNERIALQAQKVANYIFSSEPAYLSLSVRAALESTMQNIPLAVVVKENDEFDEWLWLTAYSWLLPGKLVPEINLFIGEDVPAEWRFDLAVVPKWYPSSTTKFITSTNIEKYPFSSTLKPPSYTRIINRYLDLSGVDWKQLLSNVDKIWGSENPNRPYDDTVGRLAMPTIGIDLLRTEIREGNIYHDDIQWIWRYATDNLFRDDVSLFLPILLEKISDWGKIDYGSYSSVLSKYPDAVEEITFRMATQSQTFNIPNFIIQWTKHTENLTDNQERVIIRLFQHFVSTNPEDATNAIIAWIEVVTSKEKILGIVLEIVQHCPANYSPTNSLTWIFFNILAQLARNDTDIGVLHQIFRNFASFDAELIKKLLENLVDSNHCDNAELLIRNIIESSRGATGIPLRQIILSLINIVTLGNSSDIFVALVLVICKYSRGTISVHAPDVLKKWDDGIIRLTEHASTKSAVGAYILFLSCIGNPDEAQSLLTDLLRTDLSFFHTTIAFIQSCDGVVREDYSVSVDKLSDLDMEEQLFLFVEYILSVKSANFVSGELEYFYHLLLKIDDISSLREPNQQRLRSVLFRNNKHVYQRFVEHRLRCAVKNGDADGGFRELEYLRTLSEQMCSKPAEILQSNLKTRTVISYLKDLSLVERVQFYRWLLYSPIYSYPHIVRLKTQPYTAKVLMNNRNWLVEDIFVRVSIFDYALDDIQRNQIFLVS